MDKKEKKSFIGLCLDLAGGHFTDSEVDTMYDVASNPQKYDGMSKTMRPHISCGWSSEGSYTRKEETTYTLHVNDEKMYIEENTVFHDDDGESGSSNMKYNTGRLFINLFRQIFMN